jgi:hypothetical protein
LTDGSKVVRFRGGNVWEKLDKLKSIYLSKELFAKWATFGRGSESSVVQHF